MNNSDSDTSMSAENPKAVKINSPEEGASVVNVGDDKRKKRSKAPPIENLTQLLRGLYTSTFKRSKLNKKEISAIRAAAKLSESEREELLRLAMSDRLLDRTRQLMLLAAGIEPQVVTGQIRDFVGHVLRSHPAFGTSALTGVLENLPEAPADDMAVQALISQDYLALSWPDDARLPRKRDVERCKANAVYCLLLWFRATRGMSIERIQRHLQEYLWKPAARRYKTDAEKIRVLVSNKDLSAASISCTLIEKRASEQSHRAEVARRSAERATSRARQLEEQISGLRAELSAAHVEIERLRKDLEREVQAHGNDRAHLKDDYEQLRGQILRRLKEELSLLDEGLHALRREPPKVHVMVDHAERAIDGLKREVDRLKGNN